MFKPSRTLFDKNTSSEAAHPSTSELLPSPSQIDPEFLAALPDDVREELEQAYKRKDSHVTHVRIQAPVSDASVFPPERSTEESALVVESDDVHKKEAKKVNAPRKQVNVTMIRYSMFLLIPLHLRLGCNLTTFKTYTLSLIQTDASKQFMRVFVKKDRSGQ